MTEERGNRVPITVGVTGHRLLRQQDLPALHTAVRELLVSLQQKYPHSPVVMLSSLAEGADLLCADIAEELGIPLVAVLPRPRAEYEKDFSLDGKQCLEKHCRRAEQMFVAPRTEPLPAEGEGRDDQFRQAGIYISAHSHILLALWDGKPGMHGCGTAEAVDFALHGIAGPENALPVRTGSNTLVWHVLSPRDEADPESAGSVRILGNEEALGDILKKTDEFNQLAVSVKLGKQRMLPEEETDDVLLSRLLRVYGTASKLSKQYARQYRKILSALAVASALITMAFLLYDEAEAIGMILAIGVMLLLAWFGQRYAGRSACLRRYIEYRVLAESLRVSIFLRYAGSAVRTENLLSWTQQEESAWILDALSALCAGAPPERKHDIRRCWVEEQREYHQQAEKKASRDNRISSRVVGTALRLSILLYVMALLFELFCGGVLTAPLLPAANAESWRTLLKIVLGSISAVTLFVANYYGRLSLSRVLSDHGKMARFFARMSGKLREEGQTEALLTTLAREELIENGNWCSYERDNQPEFSL